MPADEADLLQRLRRGEAPAFAEAFETFADRLYRVALRVVHDPDEAEDVVQETFIVLSRRLEVFEGRSSLGTWLYRVAYNEALQRLRTTWRRAGRAAPGHTALVDDGAGGVADEAPGPSEWAEAGELHDHIDAAIAALPASLRSALLLRDVEGLSTAEAAELLRITPSALKVRVHRARLALRELLSPEPLPPTTMAGGIACAEVVAQLSAYLDGELDEETRARIEAHVADCNHCRVTIDSTRSSLALAGARRNIVLPPPRSARLFERLRAVFASRPDAAGSGM